jgi:hypothetical protein
MDAGKIELAALTRLKRLTNTDGDTERQAVQYSAGE